MDDVSGDIVGDWRRSTEPRLAPAWRAQAGSQDTTVHVTLAELEEINRAVGRLLAPYVRRERPEDARAVRILRHVMPAGAPEQASDRRDDDSETVTEE